MKTIQARDSTLGGLYDSPKGRRLTVVSKQTDGRVKVKVKETGHLVSVPPEYPLSPVWETLFKGAKT